MRKIIEKFAPLGVVAAAASCTACFPALAGIASALGLGVFVTYEKEALMIMQILIIVTILFAYLSYRRTKYIPSFVILTFSGCMMLYSWYITYNASIFYIGMIGIVLTSFWNLILERKYSTCKVKL